MKNETCWIRSASIFQKTRKNKEGSNRRNETGGRASLKVIKAQEELEKGKTLSSGLNSGNQMASLNV